jgi:bacteriocin leader peptide (microcyclamide/patellamide family)
MDKQNLMPQPNQPITRITTGQLPPELAELSEETLQLPGNSEGAFVTPAYCKCTCSYDGDDAE